jgi:hypothetical protein
VRVGERSAVLRSLRVFERLAAAREAPDELSRLRLLVQAIERANYRFGHTFDPTVIAALHHSIGAMSEGGAVFARGSIGRALEDETNFPERRRIVGERGEPGHMQETKHRFFPLNGIDLYNMLDWMRADATAD